MLWVVWLIALTGCWAKELPKPPEVNVRCPEIPRVECPRTDPAPLNVCSRFVHEQMLQYQKLQDRIDKLQKDLSEAQGDVVYWKSEFYDERNRRAEDRAYCE